MLLDYPVNVFIYFLYHKHKAYLLTHMMARRDLFITNDETISVNIYEESSEYDTRLKYS